MTYYSIAIMKIKDELSSIMLEYLECENTMRRLNLRASQLNSELLEYTNKLNEGNKHG